MQYRQTLDFLRVMKVMSCLSQRSVVKLCLIVSDTMIDKSALLFWICDILEGKEIGQDLTKAVSLMEILEQRVKEVSEIGRLSFSVHRAQWLALGPWEERNEMDNSPQTRTESLQKRAQLALACAKKVAKVWAAYDPEDKGPQTLVKQGNAYLSGKLAADKLSQAWRGSDYINQTEQERYSSAPMAAIAAERATAVALYDEFLLEPRYADADDTDLDPYDWDAAWCASLA